MNARSLTPALARERARMGALRGRAMGGCGCGCGSRTLGALGDPVGDVSAQYQAAISARVASQSASVQAELQAQTGVNTQQASVAQGSQSALALFQNGYNPASDADNKNLVFAIAGGLALVPGIGPLLGGAVLGLWAVGQAAACPLENAFSAIGFGSPSPACGGRPCASSGNWTPATILGINSLPPRPRGSFAEFATAALAQNAATGANCKAALPPSAIVDGCVALWNRLHAGPAAAYYVPLLAAAPGAMAPSTSLFGGDGAQVSGTSAAARAGLSPNIFYAFGPASAAAGAGLSVSGSAITYNALASGAAGAVPPGSEAVPARLVMVNTGGLIVPHVLVLHLGPVAPTGHVLALHLGPSTAAAAAPAAGKSSTAAKVAGGAALAGAGALAWWMAKNGWKWRTPRWAGKLVR